MYNVLQLEVCLAYLVPPALCIYVCMWRNFWSRRWTWLHSCDSWKSSLGIVPPECLHTYSAWNEKGSRGVLGGPTDHFIQIAVHVKEMKACKWLPVIVPIKEQLRLVVSMALYLATLHCLIFRWTSSKSVFESISEWICLFAAVCLCV